MSFVTVQLGQCGNQLGLELFRSLGNELLSTYPDSLELCFRHDQHGHFIPRCLLVDMEPKAVHECLQTSRSRKLLWTYDTENVIIQQSGSGFDNCSHVFMSAVGAPVIHVGPLQGITGLWAIICMACNVLRPWCNVLGGKWNAVTILVASCLSTVLRVAQALAWDPELLRSLATIFRRH